MIPLKIRFSLPQPPKKPLDPNFSSGPTRKHPQWNASFLEKSGLLGRSHRSEAATALLKDLFGRLRRVLDIPASYAIGLIGGSATGAMEALLWNFLGARGVDIITQGFFGRLWKQDIVERLKIKDYRLFESPKSGVCPNVSGVDFARDVVLVYNGTTSGVCLPDLATWIPEDRRGFVLADVTSAAFNLPLSWNAFDGAVFPFQKGLGGEAQHGIVVLSPRLQAFEKTYTPPWPVPRLYNLSEESLSRLVINTPSMMVLADAMDALGWIEDHGGVAAMIQRTRNNYLCLQKAVAGTDFLAFNVQQPAVRSSVSPTLHIDHPLYNALDEDQKEDLIRQITEKLAEEKVAFDIHSFRAETLGFRLWIGGLTSESDVRALTDWLVWAAECAIQTLRSPV